jgi:hypothetical protein
VGIVRREANFTASLADEFSRWSLYRRSSQAHPYTQQLLYAVPVPDPVLHRERLRRVPPDLGFLDGDGGSCIHGGDHGSHDTPEWHEVTPGRGVSCCYWPREQARPHGFQFHLVKPGILDPDNAGPYAF